MITKVYRYTLLTDTAWYYRNLKIAAQWIALDSIFKMLQKLEPFLF